MLSILRRAVRAFRNRYSSPQDYWNRRYRRLGSACTAPGCIDLTEEQNAVDYDEKWEHLREVLRARGLEAGASVLDAGCGNGSITQRLVVEGYCVTAADFSEAALYAARSRNLPGVSWIHSPLHLIETTERFDAVLCVDVVHHIVDDAIVELTLARLASLIADDGILVVQTHFPVGDAFADEAGKASAHVRWRSPEEMRAALPDDVEVVAAMSYALPEERATKEIWTIARSSG